MSKKTIRSLNPLGYFGVNALRRKKFKKAEPKPLPLIYPVNALAKKLHPEVQHVIVDSIVTHHSDCKTYRLKPNPEKGTSSLAYFTSGQYLTVFLSLDHKVVQRAYSLCSSPSEVKSGYYEITVKRVKGGLASNYILDTWKKGDFVSVSSPEGNFVYQPLRDAKTVLCLAGGSGITPFLSMTRSIASGEEDFNMVLLYGSREKKNILFKKELDELAKASDKIQVIHVLSEEKKEGYESGFLTAELIRKYAPKDEPYSIFVSGPQAMMDVLHQEIDQLGLEKKYVRFELYGEIHDASIFKDHPLGRVKDVTIKAHIADQVVVAKGKSNETILQILEREGIAVPNRCRSGECGWCHSYVISGEYYVPEALEYRRKADFKFGFIHPCVSFPLSDMEIDVPLFR